MSKEYTITLAEKEIHVLWSIACWFDNPLVSDSLKYKLAKTAYSPNRENMDKRYNPKISQRIIKLGEYLKDKEQK